MKWMEWFSNECRCNRQHAVIPRYVAFLYVRQYELWQMLWSNISIEKLTNINIHTHGERERKKKWLCTIDRGKKLVWHTFIYYYYFSSPLRVVEPIRCFMIYYYHIPIHTGQHTDSLSILVLHCIGYHSTFLDPVCVSVLLLWSAGALLHWASHIFISNEQKEVNFGD